MSNIDSALGRAAIDGVGLAETAEEEARCWGLNYGGELFINLHTICNLSAVSIYWSSPFEE